MDRPTSVGVLRPPRGAFVWAPLAAFIALIGGLATRHEMWRDEVRAFSVATRARSIGELLSLAHQEAHPILWYAILRIGFSITHSNLVLPVAALAIAAGAAYLILRFAPFPFWARLLAVFGAFLGYELSVMSRNYGIGALLMMAVCATFSQRRDRPFVPAVLLALLANTSVHAALAALIIGFVWVLDLLDPVARRALMSPRTLAAVALAIVGVVIAVLSSRPPPGMLYGFSIDQLQPAAILKVWFTDPGWSLSGFRLENVTAAGLIPWRRLGLDPALVSRLLADVAVVGVAWSLRRNRACFIAFLVTIAVFEIFFQIIYSPALRQEAILAFLLISLAWIAASEPGARDPVAHRRSVAMGLLPLLATQAAALPFIAAREVMLPWSTSKEYAALINSTPRYRDAILMSEPDYLMESLPYYVTNRVYMPRQHTFGYRVQFDRGAERAVDMRLGSLLAMADSLACSNHTPVLMAILAPALITDSAGTAPSGYSPAEFRWNSAERAALFREGRNVFSSFHAMSGENYNVFEISPKPAGQCGAPTLIEPAPK